MSMQVLLRLPRLWPLFAAPAYGAGRSKQLGRLTSAQHERQGGEAHNRRQSIWRLNAKTTATAPWLSVRCRSCPAVHESEHRGPG
jgi:hypothetical protein